MTLEAIDRDVVPAPHARQAVVAAVRRTTQGLAGAELVDDVRTIPLERDLRLVVSGVERCGDRDVRRAGAALTTACAHLAAGRAEDAFLALEDARQRLGA